MVQNRFLRADVNGSLIILWDHYGWIYCSAATLSYYPESGCFSLLLPSLGWMSKHQDCWLNAKVWQTIVPLCGGLLIYFWLFSARICHIKSLEGIDLKYACTLHFEATPWIHLRCYCKRSQVDCKSLGYSSVLLCMCVLMTIFWYDFPFLIVVYHSAVYGQTWELSKCAWYCYWGNLPQRIPEIKTSGAPRIWATQCVCEAEDFFCFPEIQCLGGSVWQRNMKNQNNMGFWN